MSNTYDIGVIPGDGTGPEVVAQGLKVLAAVEDVFDVRFKFVHYDFGGSGGISATWFKCQAGRFCG